MRTSFFKLLLSFVIALAGISEANAQVYIKVRPVAPVIVRSVSPSPRHIWVDGEWVGNGAAYQYRNGYWVLPPARSAWVPGHWKQTRRGWIWRPGHWRRR